MQCSIPSVRERTEPFMEGTTIAASSRLTATVLRAVIDASALRLMTFVSSPAKPRNALPYTPFLSPFSGLR
jgi:hypothetical protein